MRRRTLALAVLLALSAGCLGLDGGAESSTLDLTVQNEGDAPVDVTVTVAAADGAVVDSDADSLDAGVARAFEYRAGTSGRYEVTVAGPDWTGRLAWDAATCARFDATVRVGDGHLDVVGECTEQR